MIIMTVCYLTIAFFLAWNFALMAVAVGLKAWNAWTAGRTVQMWIWVGATIAFPLITVLAQGFLGYGFAATLIVFAFVASFERLNWKVLTAALLTAYLPARQASRVYPAQALRYE